MTDIEAEVFHSLTDQDKELWLKYPAARVDIILSFEIKKYYADMLGACLFLYPWNKSGTPLATMIGPSREQERWLDDLSDEIQVRGFDGVHPVESIEMAVTSGHGGGKTELIGMASGVLMSTRDGMHGTVTANNGQQLRDKTWASIQKYKKLLICSHWFEITSEKFWRIGRKEDWFMSAVTWKEENADAFQGQHAATSSSIYIFDEDSNIPDTIHTAAEGGTIHGEAMIFRFGNCTRREGNFYQRCFGDKRQLLINKTLGPSKGTAHPASLRRWDTSETQIRNEKWLKEKREEYGEDSDYWRVRVQGLPPNAGDAQFIPADWIAKAKKNPARCMPDDALVAGVDCSWGGDDPAKIRFRCGLDARSIKPIVIPGSQTKTPDVMITKCAEVLTRTYSIGGIERRVAMMFVDSAGAGDLVVRRLMEMGFRNVVAVNFGGHSPDAQYFLVRSFMWGKMKGDMLSLAIDSSADLEADLNAPGYKITRDGKWLLEPKQDIRERLGHSTDDGDALCLTYYAPVRPESIDKERQRKRQQNSEVGAWS